MIALGRRVSAVKASEAKWKLETREEKTLVFGLILCEISVRK